MQIEQLFAMIKNIGGKEVPIVHDTKIIKQGADMDELLTVFASKLPPDNTIKRIEALEKLVHDLMNKKAPDTSDKSLDAGALESLKKRVEVLEKDSVETKGRVTTCEHEIELLKR